MSVFTSRRLMTSFDAAATFGRSGIAGRGQERHFLQRPTGMGLCAVARDLQSQVVAQAGMCEAASVTRPPAGPSTILCSSLGKERKKLAKVIKSHRKLLEKRLSALTREEADAPVLSELLSELRTLTARLQTQRAANLLQRMESDSDSSDSDDDECETRSAAALCSRRSLARCAAQPTPASATTTSAASGAGAAESHTDASTSSTMVVSTLAGQIELPVPAPPEGWAWDEDEFRAAKFEGASGRVLVCTGSKCQRKGATEVLRAVSALSDGNPNIEVVPCKCVGKCSGGAALRVRSQGQACATYTQVRPAQLPDVFAEHFAPSAPLTAGDGSSEAAGGPSCCVECQRP